MKLEDKLMKQSYIDYKSKGKRKLFSFVVNCSNLILKALCSFELACCAGFEFYFTRVNLIVGSSLDSVELEGAQ